MGSSDHRLFDRQRTVHEILGGGFVADMMLWRQKNVTLGTLIVALAAWVVFEISGYTLLSLVSSILLLLFGILFFWSKSAEILNRPAPPLPKLHLSEEGVSEAATFIREHVNALLSLSQNVALGKDPKMFVKVAAYLGLISFVGGFTDFLTFGYISLVIVLTVPAVYERYEDHIDKYLLEKYWELQEMYLIFDEDFEECVGKVRNWILEVKKLS